MFFAFHLFYKIAISYSAKCVTEASDKIIYSSLWDQWWWQCNSRYEKKQQEGMFSWTKRLVRQVVQRILDAVLWPSPVTAHWVACQQSFAKPKNGHSQHHGIKWSWNAPLKVMVKFVSRKGLCQLKIDTCHLHLWKLYHGHCNFWLSMALKGVQGEDQEWGIPCSGKNWQNRPSDS